MSKRQQNQQDVIVTRMLWADVLKIIAIYFVVHLHTVFTPLDKISVPLFVMVSGALLLGKKEHYSLFFRKRFIKVLLPWIFWTVIYMIYFLYFAFNRQAIISEFFSTNPMNGTVYEWGRYFIRMFFSALWFLPMIFSLYLLTPILRIIMHKAGRFEKYYMVSIWFIFFSLLPFIFDNSIFPKYQPNLLFTAFQYSGYFILGLLLTKLESRNKIIIAACIVLATSIFFIKRESSFIDPATLLASISFFYLVFSLSKTFGKSINTKTKHIIAVLGGASFGIYVLHGLIGGLLNNQMRVFLTSLHIEFLAPVILFTVSAIIVLVLQRIPIIKYIVP